MKTISLENEFLFRLQPRSSFEDGEMVDQSYHSDSQHSAECEYLAIAASNEAKIAPLSPSSPAELCLQDRIQLEMSPQDNEVRPSRVL